MFEKLSAAFSAASPIDKALFLARVAYNSTVDARANGYVVKSDKADGVVLRRYNEFIHRVTGYMMHVLKGTEMEGQDASVMKMIFDFYGAGSEERQRQLAGWLHVESGSETL